MLQELSEIPRLIAIDVPDFIAHAATDHFRILEFTFLIP